MRALKHAGTGKHYDQCIVTTQAREGIETVNGSLVFDYRYVTTQAREGI